MAGSHHTSVVYCTDSYCSFQSGGGFDSDFDSDNYLGSAGKARRGFCFKCRELTDHALQRVNKEGETVKVWDPQTGLVLRPAWCAECRGFVLSKKDERRREQRARRIWGELRRHNNERHSNCGEECPSRRKHPPIWTIIVLCDDHPTPVENCDKCQHPNRPVPSEFTPCAAHTERFMFTVYDCPKCDRPLLKMDNLDLFSTCPACLKPTVERAFKDYVMWD